MKKKQNRLFKIAVASTFLFACTFPALAPAQTEDLSKKVKELEETVAELEERLDEAELHTSSDKVSFGVDMRTKWGSIHYKDMLFAPSSLITSFFTPVASGGFHGATLSQIQAAIGAMTASGTIPAAEKYNIDNGSIWTNKFRLNMKAKVNNNLSFAGRIAAYKVFGDSSGVKTNTGSLGDVTMDGNSSSLPHGDTLRLERAYFNYKNQIGTVPYNFSLGRRPSTEGPPREYGNYSLEGGSPMATIINWQFDGASLNFGLEELTSIPGMAFKLCYGVGFEGDWGNSYSLNSQPDVDDVHLAGFISSLYDDDTTKVELNYAHASDITDGFTGLTVMPFIVSKSDTNGDGTSEYYFTQNTGGYVSRVQPMTNIGDWDAATLVLRSNAMDVDYFFAGSWSHTKPERVSKNPYYEMLGQTLLNSNGEMEKRDGYMVLIGAVVPMPYKGRLGLEYNWGSKYWFNFTGAEDSLVGSKMAVRGQVYEGYYIQPVSDDNFFVKLGYQYYDYEYTGSGNPMGAPVKISEATGLDSMFPVVDKVWNAYISATLRF